MDVIIFHHASGDLGLVEDGEVSRQSIVYFRIVLCLGDDGTIFVYEGDLVNLCSCRVNAETWAKCSAKEELEMSRQINALYCLAQH